MDNKNIRRTKDKQKQSKRGDDVRDEDEEPGKSVNREKQAQRGRAFQRVGCSSGEGSVSPGPVLSSDGLECVSTNGPEEAGVSVAVSVIEENEEREWDGGEGGGGPGVG
ncbi:unnamed protein product [Leuciscus chuanchicus]